MKDYADQMGNILTREQIVDAYFEGEEIFVWEPSNNGNGWALMKVSPEDHYRLTKVVKV